jgi:hypothetical protein
MSDLTTVDAAKEYIGIVSPDADGLLDALIKGESAFIESYCSRPFSVQEQSQLFPGNGKSQWTPKFFPITEVKSLKINGIAIPEAQDITSPGWFLSNDTIYLNGYAFAWSQVPNCACTYMAGLVPTNDIVHACNELVAIRYKERDRIGKSSESLAGETTAYIVKAMPDHVAAILKPYRRVTA